ncbi:hypothetical protein A3D85_02230 [Candidatus Amesbacteria bacterium RIFCSPHIGHO2_02_FULL_47_9]|uniref:Uncharacterized protein n=1 Tax=Candidatus Amesbacteria bacterium RIFCSPHIGHO2_01_FULL_48_32b TaxID=1797253 RepID=A0A1F4YIM8_9BACT|nr:MAG: hypothetical protein A2876_00965 [Candidatus Amesbacteria bacterium RIFCSPHIGHO2_01_FULL_48_32b]OGD05035.1 MAG: hypothetical protein A3D85_02230 [Candidatus Amesbacteria bacterium RIFCSPHIGHO2_02_FULL_47_9]OGD07413.1 MAG: hypothetical protein A2899_03870 [Candidatus Amesbacteria bacterium RIFCSPLOWO2_01_FULL_49_25]
MTPQDLVLNIAVNMSRLGRYSHGHQLSRVSQFLADTQNYLDQLQNFHPRFRPTYDRFLKDFLYLKSTPPDSSDWSDTAFTWASILTHRAKFA